MEKDGIIPEREEVTSLSWVKLVDGYPNYAVTKCGEVISYTKEVPFFLKQHDANGKGYRRCTLFAKQVPKKILVHRLVFEHFGNEPIVHRDRVNHQIAHLDGNRSNNHISNLVQVSAKENNSHKKVHGTHQIGEKNPNSKFSKEDILNMREMYRKGSTTVDVGEKYGISASVARFIISGLSWSHVEGACDMRTNAGCFKPKLSRSEISEIRSLYSNGCTQKQLSIQFDVSTATISRVVNYGRGYETK